jgi:hypothetical protein
MSSPIPRTKRLLLSAAAALGVAVGAAGLAGAVTGGNGSPDRPAPAPAETVQQEEPSYTSSVTAPEGPDGGSEADEAAALQPLAKISPDDARKAAVAAVPGQAAEPQLENENGNVVYGDGGEGLEGPPLVGVEAVDGLEETEEGDLDEVVEFLAPIGEATSQAADESGVEVDDRLSQAGIPGAAVLAIGVHRWSPPGTGSVNRACGPK